MMEAVGVEPVTVEQQQRQCEEAPCSSKDSARKPHTDTIMNKTTSKNQISNHSDIYMYIPVANRWNHADLNRDEHHCSVNQLL